MVTFTDNILGLSFEIIRLVRRRSVKNFGGECNLLQLYALVFIKEQKKVTMKEFAEYLLISSPSATTYADRLVKLKLAERSSDSINRKLVYLKITKEGIKLLADKMKQKRKLISPVLEKLTQKDQQEMVRILELILKTEQEQKV